jgi:cell shape-determining protein MreC
MNSIGRGRKKKRSIFGFIILFLIILFSILNIFKVQPLHSALFGISGPILKAKDTLLIPFSGITTYFSSKTDLEKENKELKEEINMLRVEVLSSEIVRSEYRSLLAQDVSTEDRIAKVVFKPPFSSFDNLILSGDFNDGDLNQKVFYENVVLGEIESINGSNATVRLYSAAGNKTPAKLPNGVEFEVEGKGTGRYSITLPRDVEIEVGDPISYPHEKIVLLGAVNIVAPTEDDLFKTVLFNIPIDFADINYVRIGKPLNVLE